jgi:UDP-N-acetylmuramoylalanine--D-glutamate ligase
VDLKGKKTVVLGAARSGWSAAAALKRQGAEVVLSDMKGADKLPEAAARAAKLGIGLALGGHSEGLLAGCALLVLSPGVPNRIPFVQAARKQGVPVFSEIELAFRLRARRWVAITGTNGKTTTTSLVHAVFQAAQAPVLLGGNIGEALADRTLDASAETAVVAEVSSFQLEDIHQFCPSVAVLTNLTPDHLDRYSGMDAYAGAKARIFENMDSRGHLVSNAMDARLQELCARARAIQWRFSRVAEQAVGAWEKAGTLWLREPGGEAQALMPLTGLRLRGPHNLENALAAACACAAFGLPWSAIVEALQSFAGVEHRLESAGDHLGVGYINDSKATNVDSVEKALQSFTEPVHLILGGRDKEGDFTVLAPLVRAHVARIYTIGEAAEKVARQLQGQAPIEACGDLATAVRSAAAQARKGEWVLLSPGCASFDQFDNYEHRGRSFKALVQALKTGVLA